MRAIVLGSAAGGGFPQWNCGCANCVAVRQHRAGFVPRTQDSLAVVTGDRIVLVNASPEIVLQMQRTPALWPRHTRGTPIAAVILTNGDLDHVLGLFSLRESQPIAVYATASVWRGLEASTFLRALRRFPEQLAARTLPLHERVLLRDASGASLALAVRTLPLPGKLPVYRSDTPSDEDNIGLAFEHDRTLVYASACATAMVPEADVVLFDGTFFYADELPRLGLGSARAADMAHVPIESTLSLGRGRRIYTHINNSNPILDPGSAEHRAVRAAGWEVASDGMEIEL